MRSDGQPALELDGSGNITDRNLIALNPAHVAAVMAQELVSSPTSGGPELWMVDDNLGSPREVTDSSGTVVDKNNRNSFGATAYESNPSTAHWAGFAGGHESAVTSLIINGARWYDALTGRWLSNDPSGFAGHDANLQRYVRNDATNAIDPRGLFQQSISWSAQNGKLRETMTVTGDNGGTTTSYVESLLGNTTMQCTSIGGAAVGLLGSLPPFTVSVGWAFDITLGIINVNGSFDINVGPGGCSGGPSFGYGPGLGLGANTGPQVTVTNAPNVAALGGTSTQLGGWVAAGPGVGAAYIDGAGYEGITISAGGPGVGGGVYGVNSTTWLWW